MFIKNMSNREKYIALATILFIALAVIYAFIIEPISKESQALNNEMKVKSASLKRDINILSAKSFLEANYSKFAKYVKSDKNEEDGRGPVVVFREPVQKRFMPCDKYKANRHERFRKI